MLYTWVILKVRVLVLYLNRITTYRVTHEAKIQSHIGCTSPHSQQVCLDIYLGDISICQVFHRIKVHPGYTTISWLHFEHLHWNKRRFLIFGERWKSDGAKSGLVDGCGRIFQHQELKRISVVATLRDRVSSYKRITHTSKSMKEFFQRE